MRACKCVSDLSMPSSCWRLNKSDGTILSMCWGSQIFACSSSLTVFLTTPWRPLIPAIRILTHTTQTDFSHIYEAYGFIYIWLFLLTCTAWCSSPPDVWIIKSQRKKCFLLYQKQNIAFLILFYSIPKQKILNCISIWGKISPPHTLVQARAHTCAFPFWISLLLYFYKALVFTVSHNFV